MLFSYVVLLFTNLINYSVGARADAGAGAGASASSACATITSCDPVPDVRPEDITGKMLVAFPVKYIPPFLALWKQHLPDLSDLPTFDPVEESLSFWLRYLKKKDLARRKGKKRKKAKKPHRILKGVCAQWLNQGVDFAISNNEWCVRVLSEDRELTDLTINFILLVWAYYASNMYTRPGLRSNACQKVLAYFLSNVSQIVEVWRHRLYSYSSATILSTVEGDLKDWLEEAEEDEDVPRESCLRRLTNKDGELFPKVRTTHICGN